MKPYQFLILSFTLSVLFVCCRQKAETEDFKQLYGSDGSSYKYVAMNAEQDTLFLLDDGKLSNKLYGFERQQPRDQFISKLCYNELSSVELMSLSELSGEAVSTVTNLEIRKDTILFDSRLGFLNYCWFMQRNNFVLGFDCYEGGYFFRPKDEALRESVEHSRLLKELQEQANSN